MKAGPAAAILLAALAAVTIAHAADRVPLTAYVVMGETGAPLARAVVAGDGPCPSVEADGRRLKMERRAGSVVMPLRPTQSTPENSKPSAFPVTVCEAHLRKGARHARIGALKLPLPPAIVRRIVVIGDTGCRLKASDNFYQPCNDPKGWPFARIAARAAAWKPDMVIHVGDYLYRENPCTKAGCEGSVWGYGWDAWKADFFDPGASLLAAAPWVVARGNHENCDRAGQGWWRLLDPHALTPGRDCVDPADDAKGDYSPAYGVPLGGGAQAIVFDLAIAGDKPPPAGSALDGQIRETYAALDRLSKRAAFNFGVNHKPVLGFTSPSTPKPPLKSALGSVETIFAGLNPDVFPHGFDVLLSGHVHMWQELSFSTPEPTQFIAGFSGTDEDVGSLPATLPPDATPALGAVVEHFSSWAHGFGYMTMERRGPATWAVEVHSVDGRVLNRCRITGRRSNCDSPHIADGDPPAG